MLIEISEVVFVFLFEFFGHIFLITSRIKMMTRRQMALDFFVEKKTGTEMRSKLVQMDISDGLGNKVMYVQPDQQFVV